MPTTMPMQIEDFMNEYGMPKLAAKRLYKKLQDQQQNTASSITPASNKRPRLTVAVPSKRSSRRLSEQPRKTYDDQDRGFEGLL
jgi:hypothetical protein